MQENFNTYINHIEPDFWRELCIRDGELRNYPKGTEFVNVGTVGKYVGYIKTGTLKYVAYSSDRTDHVIGLEFAGEFVADFPFSLYGNKSRVSIIAESDCEIYCISVSEVRKLMDTEDKIKDIVMHSTEALFATVYDRYVALYTQTPQQRYNDMISRAFSIWQYRHYRRFKKLTGASLVKIGFSVFQRLVAIQTFTHIILRLQ